MVMIKDCREDLEFHAMLFKLGYKPTDETPELGDIILKMFQYFENKDSEHFLSKAIRSKLVIKEIDERKKVR